MFQSPEAAINKSIEDEKAKWERQLVQCNKKRLDHYLKIESTLSEFEIELTKLVEIKLDTSENESNPHE